MSTSQLAIRFTEKQLATLDAIAAETKSTRSAVVKKLVDEADRARLAGLYAAGYPKRTCDVDDFGDLDAFHEEAENERIASRSADTAW